MARGRWEASCQPSVLSQCGATAVIMLVGDTYTLINYVSFINFLCYGMTILGLLALRWRRPALHRPIKVSLEITRATFTGVEQVRVTMTRTTQGFPRTDILCPHNPRKHVLLIFPVHRQRR